MANHSGYARDDRLVSLVHRQRHRWRASHRTYPRSFFRGLHRLLKRLEMGFTEQGILASINRSMQAILILAILGAIIASWMAAGTIPSMMYYGIKIISPKVFLVTACILCSIVSLATGSSWSTAGSMGVALMGVGAALGFPPAMTAGAVVSGAYFGDKMSPVIRHDQPRSGDGRRDTVRTHQAHGLHHRYFHDHRFGCLRNHGLHACIEQ